MRCPRLLVLAGLGLLFQMPAGAQLLTASVPSTSPVRPGQAAEIDAFVGPSSSDINGADLTTVFNVPAGSPAITFLTSSLGENFPADWQVSLDSANPLRFIALGATPVPIGKKLMVLRFLVPLNAQNGAQYSATISGITVSSQNLEQPVSATASFQIQNCAVGDLNGDSSVSLVDVQLALQLFVSKTQPPGGSSCTQTSADTNHNGQISLADVIILLKAVVFHTPLS